MLMKHNIKLTSEFGKTMCRYNIITGHDSFTGFEESTSNAINVLSLFIEIEYCLINSHNSTDKRIDGIPAYT